jgi:hypothetical protein
MAALNLTSGERMDVYRRMFLLNRSFHFIIQRLDELTQTRIVSPKQIKEMIGLTQEVQLEINTLLIEPLGSLELEDWAVFGKVRMAQEKRLRDPDDVFIHAEERRKELAKQRKKKSR